MLLEAALVVIGKAIVPSILRGALERLRGAPLGRRIERELNEWAKELPRDKVIESTTSLGVLDSGAGGLQGGPAQAEVVRLLEDKQIPGEATWLAALLERWQTIRDYLASQGMEPQPFFALPEAETRDYLSRLARRLYTACREEPALASAHVAQRVDDIQSQGTQIHLQGAQILAAVVGASVHDGITDAAQFTMDGMPEVAISRLKKLRERRGHEFDDKAKYRYLANMGTALYSLGKYEEAARAYLDAYAQTTTTEEANGFRVLALSFLDDTAEAYRAACLACSQWPSNSRVQAARIRTAPAELSHVGLRDSVPAQLKRDGEVLMALYERARDAGDLEACEAYARDATRHSPDWASAYLGLGTTLLSRVVQEQGEWAESYDALEDPASSAHQAILREAQEVLSRVISTDLKASPHTRSMAYFNRGSTHALLGDQMARLKDVQESHRIDPSEMSAIALAFAYDANEAPEKAIETLQEEVRQRPTSRVRALLASYLHERGAATDQEAATRVLREGLDGLRDSDPGIRYDYLQLQLLLEAAAGVEHLRGLLQQAERKHNLPAIGRKTLEAQALLREKRKEEAKALALAAFSARDGAGDEDLRMLARVLEWAGAAQEAVSIWSELSKRPTTGPVLNRDAAELLRCARRNNRDDILLDQCARIRERGTLHRQVAALEIDTLVRLEEYERAATLMNEYVRRFPDDFRARANRSWLGIHLGRSEMVVSDPTSYPNPKDAGAEIGTLIALVMFHGGQPRAGIDYAYRLVRCFPDEPGPHHALITMCLPGSGPRPATVDPESVIPGTAVQLELAGGRPARWIVIEDDPDPPPSPSRDEFSATDSIARALLERRIGDTVELPGNFSRLPASIKRIVGKHDFRAHRSADTWERMFPDTPFVSPRVAPKQGAGEPKSIRDVLGDEFIEDLRRAETQREEVKRAYRERKLPVAAIAHFSKNRFLETFGFLAGASDVDIRVCQGRREQFRHAHQVLDRASHVVLDEAALSALFLLKKLDVLRVVPFKCVVPQGFLDDLRHAEKRLEHNDGGEVLTIGMDGGEPRVTRFAKEVVEAQLADARSAIELLTKHCEVVGGIEGTRIASEHHVWLDELTSGTGQAISTAGVRSLPIWTDDASVAALALGLGAQGRTWTQSVYLWLKAKGVITQRDVDEMSIHLTCGRFRFTGLHPNAVLLALEQSGWNSEKEPACTVLAHLSEELDFAELSRFLAGTIRLVWRQATEDLRVTITLEILKRAGATVDGRRAAMAIARQSDSLFPLEPITAARVREVIELWAGGGRRSPLILPPSTGQLLALTSRGARCPRCHSEAEPVMVLFKGRLLPCCERCRPA